MKRLFIALLLFSSFAGLSSAVRADGDQDVGKTLFKKNCAACHGIHGDGQGPAAAGLTPAPANFTDSKFMNTQKDTDLLNTIQSGRKGSAMVGWKDKLSDDQIRQLVSYIRSLAH